MKNLDQLKREASRSANFRGHRLKWGNPFGRANGPKSCFARCRKCNMELLIIEQPAPNEINISGEAVALNCKA